MAGSATTARRRIGAWTIDGRATPSNVVYTSYWLDIPAAADGAV